MPDNKNKPTIDDFMSNLDDFGTKKPIAELSLEDRKVSALMQALNATIYQFVIEGVIPMPEQLHFMIHFQEFAGKLWKGETITLPGVPQSLNLNSQAGELFAESGNNALTSGEENANKIREMMANAKRQYEAKIGGEDDSDKQTSLEQNNDKPTLH